MRLDIHLRMDSDEIILGYEVPIPTEKAEFARQAYTAACEVVRAMVSYEQQLEKLPSKSMALLNEWERDQADGT